MAYIKTIYAGKKTFGGYLIVDEKNFLKWINRYFKIEVVNEK